MSVITYLSPEDCDPPHDLDLDSEHDRRKVLELQRLFSTEGFDKNKPALIGYVKQGRVQLISGTHRHLAALRANIKLPVVLWLGSDIDAAYGTLEAWKRIMEDVPVIELENWTREDVEKKSLSSSR